LSDQAYFAAEAGINDATKAVQEGFNAKKTDCDPVKNNSTDPLYSQPGSQYLFSNAVGDDPNIKYTCLLIDPYPTSIDLGSVGDGTDSKTFRLNTVNKDDPTVPADLKSLHISWQATGDSVLPFVSGTMASNHQFPPATSWNYVPLLRVSITPLTSGGINRTDLAKKTYVAFLYPKDSSTRTNTEADYPSYDYAQGIDANAGVIADANCKTDNAPAYDCNITINNLTTNYYVVNIRSIYGYSKVHITAQDTAGISTGFAHTQTLIDATGKAQDILHRLQVRIPSNNDFPGSDYGVKGVAGICKIWQLTPTATTSGSSADCPVP
jgi:hypothetical protein